MRGLVLKKYLSLYSSFFKASLVADLEFRANFSIRIITDIFWYLAQIFTFEVLYKHTKTIGHWNVEQTRVFLGILFVVDSFYMIALHDNLDRLSDKVRRGDLDLLLAKPVNSQFMVSFQRVGTANLGNFALAVSWLTWSLYQLSDFQWLRVLWLFVLIPCGFSALYAVRFAFSASAVLFTRSENIQFIWYQIYKLGMRPDSIYQPWIRYSLFTILPVGLIASVPARALIDPPDFLIFAISICVAPLMIYLSNRFWNFCLTRYSSASS